MRFLSLIGAVLCIVIAFGFSMQDSGWIVSSMMVPGAAFLARHAFSRRKPSPDVVLTLGGVHWNEEDFCRGWEIDGRTGSGKTASAVVPIIHQLKQNRPEVGILALDTKGDLSEPLARMAEDLDCQDNLVQLEVKPDHAAPDWKPKFTMNFLEDRSIPFSTYARIIVDVATAAGQKGGQAFFKVAAQTAIQQTLSALAELGRPVTLPACAGILTSETNYKEMGEALAQLSQTRTELGPLVRYFHEFIKQPPEQLGGVRATVYNYLQPFTAPAIAEVFSPEHPTFSLSEIDHGKLISVKIRRPAAQGSLLYSCPAAV
jgi:hypothetical protein